jgi:outer membrane receptor protein involved in Fe transport
LNTYSGRKFVYTQPDSGYEWPSSTTKNLNLIKAELSVKNNKYYLGLKGYYYRLNFDANEMSRKWEQDDSVLNIELRGDKSLFNNNGLISVGISYKENRILDSTISSRGYPPDFIGDDNFFKPFTERLTISTFTNTIYAQYQHHFKKVDILLGGRKDKHSVYDDYINYNGSVLYKPIVGSEIKFTYGTAYRTPYAAFLNEESDPKPEKVTSYNLEFKKEFGNKSYFKLSPFYNEVKDFLIQDPYGGMSDYTDFNGAGLETVVYIPFGKKFEINANLTYQQIWADKENYNVLQYIIIWPDGTMDKVYKDYEKIYHEGANVFGNLNGHWKINKFFNFDLLLKYIGDREYQILPDENIVKMKDYYVVDMGIRSQNLIKNLYIDFIVKDLFESEKSNMGELNYVEAEGRRFIIKASYKF